jgi:general secretion pathway protein J
VINREASSRRYRAGFTLIELLVAMAIFAVISALALGGLSTLVTQQTLAKAEMIELADLQRAIRMMTGDFAQLSPRVVRDTLGRSTEPYLSSYGAGDYLVRFTHGGWRNPARFPRGSLQRVQYRIEEEELLREYWPVLDHPLGMEPRSQTLIGGVEEAKIEYLDEDQKWHEQWPPLALTGTIAPPRPLAVRISLTLAGWGEIERLVEIVQ